MPKMLTNIFQVARNSRLTAFNAKSKSWHAAYQAESIPKRSQNKKLKKKESKQKNKKMNTTKTGSDLKSSRL